MNLTRRSAFKVAGGVASVALIPVAFSRVASAAMEDAIAAFTGGAEATDGGGLTITAPEIAENG
ncbi:MAG: thiosulfate oxidation carrier protein SoxY, partial [Geminicoccaceae bacterium]|nr:thiosulfate oxidation carrier protein SoxY [Geminicoccaceae bacterium]